MSLDKSILDFFVGTDASDIDLSKDIYDSLSKIAASSEADTPGDGSNALRLASVYTEPVAALGGVTMRDFFTSLVSGIGVAAQKADNMVDSQAVLVEHLQNRRDG